MIINVLMLQNKSMKLIYPSGSASEAYNKYKVMTYEQLHEYFTLLKNFNLLNNSFELNQSLNLFQVNHSYITRHISQCNRIAPVPRISKFLSSFFQIRKILEQFAFVN